MSETAFRNGVPRQSGGGGGAAGRRGFAPRLISGRGPGKLEAAVVAAVVAAVFGVAVLLVQMPGPLVVQVRDDRGAPVVGAQVSCTSPTGDRRFSGSTDVFGEAKWPGLAKGPWTCQVTPPVRYHAGSVDGSAVVQARRPAVFQARVERPARLVVQVKRPQGAPRAAVAVRAVCEGDPAASWEARAGVLDGSAILWLPHGRACRVGLVRPELPAAQPGPVPAPRLSCEREPCRDQRAAGVGEELALELTPTAAQWEAARPAPEPDEPR